MDCSAGPVNAEGRALSPGILVVYYRGKKADTGKGDWVGWILPPPKSGAGAFTLERVIEESWPKSHR